MNTFKGKVRIAEISMEENRCGNQKQLSRRTVETEHLTDYRDLIINSTINTQTNFVKFKIRRLSMHNEFET